MGKIKGPPVRENYDKINHSWVTRFYHRGANRFRFVSARGLIMAFVKLRQSVEVPTRTQAEGEIQESLRETTQGTQAESEVVADSIGLPLKQVAGCSEQEINR
jgi:hypothetical protein